MAGQGPMGQVWGLKKNPFIKWGAIGFWGQAIGVGSGKKTCPEPDPLPFLNINLENKAKRSQF